MIGTELKKTLEDFDQFYETRDIHKLCSGTFKKTNTKLPMKIYNEMWKEYGKINYNTIRNKLRKKQSQFRGFAKKRTGLTFKKFSIESVDSKTNKKQEKGYDQINVTLWETGKQNLGFYGNYIDEVHYYFYSDSSWSMLYNPKRKEYLIWIQAGIGYTHKSGGRNGNTDTGSWKDIFYNLNTNKLTFSKTPPKEIEGL